MVHPTHTFLILLVALMLLPGGVSAQASAPPMPAAALVRDPIQGAWDTKELEHTRELWRAKCANEDHMDLNVRFNLLRSERNAALARGKGSLAAEDQHVLDRIAAELERTAPLSFEAHMAHYYTAFPKPDAFASLAAAHALEGNRSELLGPLLTDAARRFDPSALKERAVALKAQGGVRSAFLLMADDLMLSVGPGAVLFVAGDMDALPLWIRQYADGQRKDLLVVDVRLLNEPTYRKAVWNASGATGAAPSTGAGFIERLVASNGKRPIYLALSLGAERLAPFKEYSYATGLALKYSRTPVNNLPLIEERWQKFNKPTGAGPLSRNYLLPASILLTHYRSMGDEAKASKLELELRRFAEATGSIAMLYTLGILEH